MTKISFSQRTHQFMIESVNLLRQSHPEIVDSDNPDHYKITFKYLENLISPWVEENLPDNVLADLSIDDSGHHGLGPRTLKEINQDPDIDPWHPYAYSRIRHAIRQLLVVGGSILSSPKQKDITSLTTAQFDRLVFAHGNELRCECQQCGTKIQYRLDIDNKRLAPDSNFNKHVDNNIIQRCPAANLAPQVIPFPVPSGKLVIANDLRALAGREWKTLRTELRQYLVAHGEPNGSINSKLGERLQTWFYLQYGLLYLQAGNRSPEILQGEDEILMGNYLDAAEFDLPEALIARIANYSSRGSVCTDLWAINAMDYDLFISRCKAVGIDPEDALDEYDALLLSVPGEEIVVTDYYSTHAGEDQHILFEIKTPPSPAPANVVSIKP